jgi:hypothetical protein
MNDPKRTVKARLCNRLDTCGPGDCTASEDSLRLEFACPGCGAWGSIRVGRPKPPGKPTWEIVAGDIGNPETLTLAPSIDCKGCCGWHGFLFDGEFRPA